MTHALTWKTDHLGIAHHASYIVWCEVGRANLCRATGSSSHLWLDTKTRKPVRAEREVARAPAPFLPYFAVTFHCAPGAATYRLFAA